MAYLAGREIRDIWKQHNTVLGSVMRQEESIKDEADTVIYRKELLLRLAQLQEIVTALQDNATTHYSDVERLASDEHWKNCQVDKCPNMPNIISNLKQNNERLTEIIEGLRGLTIEIIATLRTLRTNGHAQ
jgi:hypothetical protein